MKAKIYSVCILVLLFFVLCVPALDAQEVRVVSFNIQGKDHWARTGWLEDIAATIREGKADVVLLQEVPKQVKFSDSDRCFLKELIRLLGHGWSYVSSKEYALTKDVTVGEERYGHCTDYLQNAIVYNGMSVVLQKNLAKGLGFTIFPYGKGKFLFDQNNVVAVQFGISGAQSKTFIAVNVHLKYGTMNARRIAEGDPQARDLDALKRMLEYLQQRYPRSGIFAMGDFNYNLDLLRGSWPRGNLPVGLWFIDEDIKFWSENEGNPWLSTTTGGNNFDHIITNMFLQNRIGQPLTYVLQSFKKDNVWYTKVRGRDLQSDYGKETAYHKEISDHFPILTSFYF